MALSMAPHVVLAALALACLGAASEPDCGELVKPLLDLSSSLGKWIFYAGTTDSEETLAKLKTISSSWINPKHLPNDGPTTMEIVDKINGQCIHLEANVSSVGNKIHMSYTYENQSYTHDGEHLETCPDCLLWTDTTRTPGAEDVRFLFIFTRTGTLPPAHLEVFKQQAACLNFTSGLHMGSNTDLCPEEKDEKAEKEDE